MDSKCNCLTFILVPFGLCLGKCLTQGPDEAPDGADDMAVQPMILHVLHAAVPALQRARTLTALVMNVKSSFWSAMDCKASFQ